MSEPGTELDVVRPTAPAVGHFRELPSDDEVRRMYRIAEGLARSGVYKDSTQAGQAFAKILVGRDLGLTPARAMSGLHFVEGQVQCHYRTLGAFVRENGYDFRFPAGIAEITDDDLVVLADEERKAQPNPNGKWAAIDFYGPRDPDTGEREYLGRSTFTQHNAATAELGKPTSAGKASNYMKYPRNMLVGRAMSNGVGFYCPEVLGGLPVYVEGEIVEDRAELTAGSGTGEAQGLDLGPVVDKLLERAKALGATDPRLTDRATVEMVLGGRGPEIQRNWEIWARQELDKIDPEVETPDVKDADVVEGHETDTSSDEPPEPSSEQEEPIDAESMVKSQAAEAERQETAQRLRLRLDELAGHLRRADLSEDQIADLEAEVDSVEAELAATENPEQGQLGV